MDKDGDGKGPPDGKYNDDGKGPKRRYKGKGKFLGCRGHRDMSAECINSYYYKLSENNEWEWVMALGKAWWGLFWLAFGGPLIIPTCFMMGWIVLFFPYAKPDIDRLPDWRIQPITTGVQIFATLSAMTAEPGLFFLTQFLSWGESDLRDFALIYMTSEEAFMYFMIATVFLSMLYLPSISWMAMFWWVYYAQFAWKGIKMIFNLFDDDGDDYKKRRGKGRGRGRGGDDDDDDDDKKPEDNDDSSL